MKTNISGLMAIIAEEENKFKYLSQTLCSKVYTTSIQELDGTVNITDDNLEEFERKLADYKTVAKKISKLKSVLYEKNNKFKLSDGRTIQEAIVDNTNLRKMKATYDSILMYRNSKRRFTEVNNSYFECKNINYDIKELESESKELEIQIQNTDFEISKLNSIEFEIKF